MKEDDFTKAAKRMLMNAVRFEFIAAALAWDVSRRLNGPFHETTRALASRLEFAQAHIFALRHQATP